METQQAKAVLENQKPSSISNSTLFKEVAAHREETKETRLTLEAYRKDISDLRAAWKESDYASSVRISEICDDEKYLKQLKPLSNSSGLDSGHFDEVVRREDEGNARNHDTGSEQLENIDVEREAAPDQDSNKAQSVSVSPDPSGLFNIVRSMAFGRTNKVKSSSLALEVAETSSSFLKGPDKPKSKTALGPTIVILFESASGPGPVIIEYNHRGSPDSMPMAGSTFIKNTTRAQASSNSKDIVVLQGGTAYLSQVVLAPNDLGVQRHKVALKERIYQVRTPFDQDLTSQDIRGFILVVESRGAHALLGKKFCVKEIRRVPIKGQYYSHARLIFQY